MSGRKLSVKIRKLRKIENQMAGERLWTWKRFRLFFYAIKYMIKNRNETSAAMDKALKNLEQAKARYEAERKKENEKRRKAQNHHKYLMGGIVAKYFPECYQYEEKELNVILSAALASAECRQAVENVKRMEKNADDMEDEKDRNGGHADETKTKENSGGYANSKDFAGGSFSQGV